MLLFKGFVCSNKEIYCLTIFIWPDVSQFTTNLKMAPIKLIVCLTYIALIYVLGLLQHTQGYSVAVTKNIKTSDKLSLM